MMQVGTLENNSLVIKSLDDREFTWKFQNKNQMKFVLAV